MPWKFFASLALGLVLLGASPAVGQQVEITVPCVEGQSTALGYSSHATCSIDGVVDSDRFTLFGTAGTKLRLNVLGFSGAIDPAIEMFDPMGNPVPLSPASCDGGFSACSFSTDVTVGKTGVFTFFVTDSGFDNLGDYLISLTCVVGNCDSDGVPPGDPAPPTLVYDAPVNETLNEQVDVDTFLFHGDPSTLVRVNVLGYSGAIDPTIEIFDPAGAPVSVSPTGCDGGFSECSFSTDLTLPVAGTYRLLISDAGLDNPGGYLISLNCVAGNCDGDGDGFADPDPAGVGYEVVLPPQPELAAGLATQVDVDRFSFAGQQGTQVRLIVSSTSGAVDPCVEIRNPDGTSLPLPQSCCDGGFGTCSFSTDVILPQTGAFRLLVWDQGLDNVGSYQFSLGCRVGSCPSALPTPAPVCTGGNTVACRDNCQYQPDPLQLDIGGVGPGSAPDGIGDFCQCGDVSGDGRVTLSDTLRIARSLLVPPTATLEEPDRCDVSADSSCALADAVIVRRSLLSPPTAAILQSCPAAFR